MPSHQYNALSGYWELLLDNASTVSDAASGLHCVCPVNAPNGYVCFAKCGQENRFVARKIATGLETQLIVMSSGGKQEAAADSRYCIMAQKISQGKQFDSLDLIATIFDTEEGAFLDFSTQPALNQFRQVGGSGSKTRALWVQNGRQVNGFEGGDPVGRIRRVTFTSATKIQYVLEQRSAGGQTIAFREYERSFVLSNGSMGAITESSRSPWVVNPQSPTQPTWIRFP